MKLLFAARSALTAGGAVVVATNVAAGAIIAPGLSVRSESYEFTTPLNGAEDFEIALLASTTDDGIAVHTEASMSPGVSLTTADVSALYGGIGLAVKHDGVYTSPTSGLLTKAQTRADASFRDDTVVITEPGMTGTGTFTAEYEVDTSFVGSLIESFQGPGASVDLLVEYTIEVLIGDLRDGFTPHSETYTGMWQLDENSNPVDFDAKIPVSAEGVEFEYGVPFTIAASVTASTFLVVDGPGSVEAFAELRLGPTFKWEGIGGLGEPAQVVSENRDDWTEPVDIPASGPVGLIAAASLVAARAGRRRYSSS